MRLSRRLRAELEDASTQENASRFGSKTRAHDDAMAGMSELVHGEIVVAEHADDVGIWIASTQAAGWTLWEHVLRSPHQPAQSGERLAGDACRRLQPMEAAAEHDRQQRTLSQRQDFRQFDDKLAAHFAEAGSCHPRRSTQRPDGCLTRRFGSTWENPREIIELARAGAIVIRQRGAIRSCPLVGSQMLSHEPHEAEKLRSAGSPGLHPGDDGSGCLLRADGEEDRAGHRDRATWR